MPLQTSIGSNYTLHRFLLEYRINIPVPPGKVYNVETLLSCVYDYNTYINTARVKHFMFRKSNVLRT